MPKNKYLSTKLACYIGYITQAIVVNLAPLFFVIFGTDYGIGNAELGNLLLISFVTQIITDAVSVKLAQHKSFRSLAVWAHILAAAGLLLLSVLPQIIENTFAALSLAMIVYSVGGGLTEVVISPIIDAIMLEEEKEGKSVGAAALSILHSFYCWGQVLVVLLTTVLLALLGNTYWYIVPTLWAIVPFFNIFFYLRVPMPPFLIPEEKSPVKNLLAKKLFIICMILMVCAGAGEMAVSQWASLLAEKGLGISKVAGDLLGPCAFAVFMGAGRILYGLFGRRLRLTRLISLCCITCFAGYSMICLCKNPIIALLGCSVCGLSVSVMWPGGLTIAANRFRSSGSALFSILAICGDVGCSLGPWLAGVVSDAVNTEAMSALSVFSNLDGAQIALKCGLFVCAIFPVIMFFASLVFRENK